MQANKEEEKPILKDRKRLNESSWKRKKNVQKGKKVKDIGTARIKQAPSSRHLSPLITSPFKLTKTTLFFHSHMSHTRVDIVITLPLFYWEHLRWRGSGKQKVSGKKRVGTAPLFRIPFCFPPREPSTSPPPIKQLLLPVTLWRIICCSHV